MFASVSAGIAPFLELDQDPYLVLSEGKLYWIQDAYTISDRFPYSRTYEKAFKQLNYIRNSVKAVVDVYNGSVTLYVMDPRDPVLALYRQGFPGRFQRSGGYAAGFEKTSALSRGSVLPFKPIFTERIT